MNIELEVVVNEAGGVIVLTSSKKVEAMVAKLRAEAESSDDADTQESARLMAATIEDGDRATREQCAGRIEVRTYPFRPYTWGEKIEAQSAATVWEGDARRFDQGRYQMILLAKCLSKEVAEVGAFAPAIGQALVVEMFDRCEPSQERLDFFSGAPTSSPQSQEI